MQQNNKRNAMGRTALLTLASGLVFGAVVALVNRFSVGSLGWQCLSLLLGVAWCWFAFGLGAALVWGKTLFSATLAATSALVSAVLSYYLVVLLGNGFLVADESDPSGATVSIDWVGFVGATAAWALIAVPVGLVCGALASLRRSGRVFHLATELSVPLVCLAEMFWRLQLLHVQRRPDSPEWLVFPWVGAAAGAVIAQRIVASRRRKVRS